MRPSALSNRWLLLVLLNSGLVQAAVYVVRPMITYRAVDLGADAALVGAIGATFALAPLLFSIQIGRIVDRGRAGAALAVGAVLMTVTATALIFADQIYLLVLAMPFLGVGHLLTMVGGQTMIANRSNDSKLEKHFGLLTFYASMGHGVGPFIGGILADDGGPRINTEAAITFAVVLMALAILTTLPLLGGASKKAEKAQPNGKAKVRQVLAVPQFKSAIFVASAVTAVVDVLLIFLPLLGREVGLSTTEIGALLAIRAFSSMAVRVILQPLTKALGMKNLLIGGSLVTMISCLALVLFQDFWGIAIIMLISGFAMGIGQPATMAWVSRISSPATKGLAISIRLTANRFGQVTMPAIAGLVAGAGISGVFVMLAALQAASIGVTFSALKKSDPEGD